MHKERLINLPKITDRRGNLSFMEGQKHVPFHIVRAYWIYDIPDGQQMVSHAYKTQHEVIIALSGSFDVVVDNGHEKKRYTLNSTYKALYVPSMLWRGLENFSTNARCLAISSGAYDEDEYILNYENFKKQLHSPSQESKEPLINKNKFQTTHRYSQVDDCSILEFPITKHRGGDIASVDGSTNIPFAIQRIFYIYDIPSGERRGMHAHKHCHEILIAASGSFKVELDDGTNKKTVLLDRPSYGLHIPPGIWATEKEYAPGSICLALASEIYNEDDYIYTYPEFKKYRANED